jgi:hypothetical protein
MLRGNLRMVDAAFHGYAARYQSSGEQHFRAGLEQLAAPKS